MKRLLSMLVIIPILLGLVSCNLPTVPNQLPTVENTVAAVLLPTETIPEPTLAVVPETPTPTETVPAEIVHISRPKFGEGKAQVIHDQVSDKTAPEKRAYGGDEFSLGRYERPFTSEEMEYLPFIDIVRSDMYRDEDDVWAYMTIEVQSSPQLAGERVLFYGVELDEDLDGRGDILIMAEKPGSEQWTSDGVQIWKDVNSSVGSKEPMRPDANSTGDGYEILLFDQGIGSDPDMAWVRLGSDSDLQVEIAFKLNLVEKTKDAYIFLWGSWAFADEFHPEWFDQHDHFSLADAGSSLIDNDAYPLKGFAEADNVCRALSGVEPSGNLPGMCPYIPPQTTGKPSTNDSCTPINCCPSATVGCSSIWDPVLCQCVPILY